MDPLIFAGLAAAISGAAAIRIWFSDERRTRRVLRRVKTQRIADLEDGKLACIVGRIEREGELIESLITRKKCVAFDTTTNVFDGRGFTSPLRIEMTRRMVPFYVVDDTGRVRVDAPQVALSNPPVARSDRYVERILIDGQRVRIVGSVVLDPRASTHADHHYRETGGVTATITGSSNYPLLADDEK